MEENKKCGCEHDEKGCDCQGHDHEDAVIYVTFEDEDKEVACDVLGIFEVNDIEYIAVAPQDEEDILIYRYSEQGDDIQLDEIESDEEYDQVSAVFDEMFFEEAPEEE